MNATAAPGTVAPHPRRRELPSPGEGINRLRFTYALHPHSVMEGDDDVAESKSYTTIWRGLGGFPGSSGACWVVVCHPLQALKRCCPGGSLVQRRHQNLVGWSIVITEQGGGSSWLQGHFMNSVGHSFQTPPVGLPGEMGDHFLSLACTGTVSWFSRWDDRLGLPVPVPPGLGCWTAAAPSLLTLLCTSHRITSVLVTLRNCATAALWLKFPPLSFECTFFF